jgi:hypothetical protein
MNRSRFPLPHWLESLKHSSPEEQEISEAQNRVWANLQSSSLSSPQPMKSFFPSRLVLAGALVVLVLGAAVLTPSYFHHNSNQPAQVADGTISVDITKADGSIVTTIIDKSTLEKTPGGQYGYLKKSAPTASNNSFIPTAHAAGDAYDLVTFYSQHNDIYSYNLTTRENKKLVASSDAVAYNYPIFNNSNQLLAVTKTEWKGGTSTVVVIDPKTGTILHEITNGNAPQGWSPDGSKLLVFGGTQTANFTIVEMGTWKETPLSLADAGIPDPRYIDPVLRWQDNSSILIAEYIPKPTTNLDELERDKSMFNDLSQFFTIEKYTFDVASQKVTSHEPITSDIYNCLDGDTAGIDTSYTLNTDRTMATCDPSTGVTTLIPHAENTSTYSLGVEGSKVKKILIEHLSEDGTAPVSYSLLDGTTYQVLSQFTESKDDFLGSLFLIGSSDYAITYYGFDMWLVNVKTGAAEKLAGTN